MLLMIPRADRLSGQFALTQVTDWDAERLGVFTGEGHDLKIASSSNDIQPDR
jgi:hypothetical protein